MSSMIIGVLSDTHDNIHATRRILRRLSNHNVELIIHLGDIVSPFTLKAVREEIGNIKLIIVKGNNDGDVYLLNKLSSSYGWMFYSEPTILEIEGRRIFIMHGYGDASTTEKIVDALAKSIDTDILLYGHTHIARSKHINGKLVLNPGEACGYITGRHTYGIIDITTLNTEIFEEDIK
ncbi:metallophosphoesterase [Desulfurococcus sp.]|uniref:metallophosphoesterase n=2 Tax=Desulfurococcus sp. TaxID=51678 RepID=UPI00319E3BAB